MKLSVPKRFYQATVIITGGSQGLGLALAEQFVRSGLGVAIWARREEPLREAELRLKTTRNGSEVHADRVDVTDPLQVQAGVAAVVRQFGKIDIFINCAGIAYFSNVIDTNLEDVRSVFNTNFFGALNCFQAVVPVMRSQRQGHLVTISSVAATTSLKKQGIYVASKHALNSLHRTILMEEKDNGITGTLVFPGRIKSNILKNLPASSEPVHQQPFANAAAEDSTDRIAARVAQALLDQKLEYFPSWRLKLAGHFMRVMPRSGQILLNARL